MSKPKTKEALTPRPSDAELADAIRAANAAENEMRVKYSGASNFIIPEFQRAQLCASVARARYACEHSLARAARAAVIEAVEAACQATAAVRDDAPEPRRPAKYEGGQQAYAAELLADLHAQDAERGPSPRELGQRPAGCAIVAGEARMSEISASSVKAGLPGLRLADGPVPRGSLAGCAAGMIAGDLLDREIDMLSAALRSRATLEKAEAELARHDAEQAREAEERAAYQAYKSTCEHEIATRLRNQKPATFSDWLSDYRQERYRRETLAAHGAAS
jgi:hypothetical protein